MKKQFAEGRFEVSQSRQGKQRKSKPKDGEGRLGGVFEKDRSKKYTKQTISEMMENCDE